MISTRPSRVTTFMRLAVVMAERSTCASKHAVGAVLVSEEGYIIASGYNGAPRSSCHCDDPEPGNRCIYDKYGRCIRAVHAEQNIIAQCAFRGVSSKNGTLFITLAPCNRCASIIIQAGIARVWFMTVSSSNGLMQLDQAGIPCWNISECSDAD